MKRQIGPEFAPAIFVMLILALPAHSQTTGVIDYAGVQSAFAAFAAFVNDGAGPRSKAAFARTKFVPVNRDALRLASQILREETGFFAAPSRRKGGLWLSGDVTDALSRLQWIVGPDAAELISLENDGELTLNTVKLIRAARIEECVSAEAAGLLAAYISDNEGLFLFLQIAKSSHRYLLHMSRKAPTAAHEVTINAALNLDNNFDSRISPYRRNGEKLCSERPPEGFDSLVAINPNARWLNLRTKLLVPPGNITFHELAEAYAKVELGFDYLSRGTRPGAHDKALEREERLFSQRPLSDVVMTKGQNIVLSKPGEAPHLTSSLNQQ